MLSGRNIRTRSAFGRSSEQWIFPIHGGSDRPAKSDIMFYRRMILVSGMNKRYLQNGKLDTGYWRDPLWAFLFPKESDRWLTLLRIGLGFQIISYALSLRSDWQYLLAGTGGGLISRDFSEAVLSAQSALIPRLGWFVDLGWYVGLEEGRVLLLAWICLFGAGIF